EVMFPNIGPLEMILVMGVAVLLFGKRLPEVGRSLGRGIVEFKKGLNGIGDEFETGTSTRHSSTSYSSSYGSAEPASSSSAYSDATVPKFELPGAPSTSAPAASTSTPQMEYQPPTPLD